jgi:hypothetical protein
MNDHQVPHRVVEAARRAIKDRDQLRLGEVLAKLEITTATLADLAADLGCSLRHLQYAIANHHFVERFGLSEKDVREIGWSKLSYIASREDIVQSKADILHLCSTHTAAELRAWLSGGSGSEQQMTFTLSKKQRRELEDALIRHGAKRVGRALVDKEAALMTIVNRSK